MKQNYKNIYKICRKSAGLTQEEASEKLHVSLRSLSDYETGNRRVPEDIVYKMSEIYNSDWLGYEHLRTSTRLGKENLPKLKIFDLDLIMMGEGLDEQKE